MPKVPLRSFAVLFIVFSIAGCRSHDLNPIVPRAASACASTGEGSPNRNTPVVCVAKGADAVTVQPESVHVWNVLSTDRRTPPTLQWITRSGGGNLQITFKDSGCVDTPVCNGKGHCGAKVITGLGATAAAGAEIKRCRYTITLDGLVLDPDTVIVGCCS